jgi:hypothetical protein
MNIRLIVSRRITRRNRHFWWRQVVDQVRRVWSIGYRWLFNHACDEMQHDCRKGVLD